MFPANVTKLTIQIAKCAHCYICFTLRQCGYHVDSQWCDCISILTFQFLWRICGEIVVWCNRARKFLVFNHAKLPETEYKNTNDSSALCNNIFVQIWIFLSTSLAKQVSELFETLERFARGYV